MRLPTVFSLALFLISAGLAIAADRIVMIAEQIQLVWNIRS